MVRFRFVSGLEGNPETSEKEPFTGATLNFCNKRLNIFLNNGPFNIFEDLCDPICNIQSDLGGFSGVQSDLYRSLRFPVIHLWGLYIEVYITHGLRFDASGLIAGKTHPLSRKFYVFWWRRRHVFFGSFVI